MLFPTLEEVRQLSERCGVIPVFWEIPADHWSPLQIYAALSQGEEAAFLLESINTPQTWQTWSYIGCRPNLGIRVTDGTNEITAFGSKSTAGSGNTLALVQNLLEAKQSPQFPDMPEFTGGFVGFCNYGDAPLSCEFHLYDELVAYNHLKSTAVIILNLHRGADLGAQYQAAEIRAAEIATNIERFRLAPQYRDDAPPITAAWNGCSAAVTNAPDSFELYRRLRSKAPAPYLFHIRNAVQQCMGVSYQETADFPVNGQLAGFWGYNGLRRTCRSEMTVQYTPDAAYVDCGTREGTEAVLELMRSAKMLAAI